MKKIIALTLLSLFSLSPAQAASPAGSYADLIEKLSPAVVNISTTQTVKDTENQVVAPSFPPGSGFEGFNEYLSKQYRQKAKPKKATSLGSGFIIDSNGLIVTNNHVIGTGEDITVTLHNDTQLKAKIIGRDAKVDIALLKVDTNQKLPFVTFGDSDNVRVGDWVLAIGNPYGLGGSVSAGIISARARDINVGPFDDFLQTDAAINRGNSGGPMFDMNGKVIGINTAIFSPTGGNVGIGFAMPSALVQPVIEQLKTYGKSRRAWLGVKIQNLSKDIASSMGLKDDKGALVLESNKNGPADKAGLKEGDVITAISGEPVENMRKLPRIIAEKKIGEKINIAIIRSGKPQILTATLGELDSDQEPEIASEDAKPVVKTQIPANQLKRVIGIEMLEITVDFAKRYKLPTSKGLLVTAVNPNGNAAEQGIGQGNIIVKVNNQPVYKITDFETAIAAAKKLGRTSILLLVMGGDETRFIAVDIN